MVSPSNFFTRQQSWQCLHARHAPWGALCSCCLDQGLTWSTQGYAASFLSGQLEEHARTQHVVACSCPVMQATANVAPEGFWLYK